MKGRPRAFLLMLASCIAAGAHISASRAGDASLQEIKAELRVAAVPSLPLPGIERLETKPGTHIIPFAAMQATTPAAVDLTGFWYHLRLGKLESANRELERLRSEYPQWQPPYEAVQALTRLTIRDNLLNGKQVPPEKLKAYISGLSSCDDPEMAWLLVKRNLVGVDSLLEMATQCADAKIATGSLGRYLEGQPEVRRVSEVIRLRRQFANSPATQKYLEDALFAHETMRLRQQPALRARDLTASRLQDYARSVTARRSIEGAELLGWLYLNRTESGEASAWFERATGWGGTQTSKNGLGLALSRKSSDAAKAGDFAAAFSAARSAAGAGSSNALETLGWILLDNDHPSEALRAFNEAPSTENATYGRVLALRRTGDGEKASATACTAANMSSRMQQTCDDALAENLLAAYEAGQYAEVEKLSIKLGVTATHRKELRPVTAWARLRSGDAAAAAIVFESLYQERPDPDLAAGLVESLEAAGNQQRLKELRSRDEYVNGIFRRRAQQTAWSRKQFDLALRLDPETQALAGRDGWSVATGYEARSVEGEKGQGQIQMMVPRIGAQGLAGNVRMDVSLSKARLDTGTAGVFDDLGSRPAPDQRTPLARQDVLLPKITGRLELQDITISSTIATTPLGAAVNARPLGAVDVSLYKDPFIINGAIFSQPVTSSMLSFAGTKDPSTGRSWGQVVDSGAALQTIWAPQGSWSAALKGEVAVQDGHNVKNNSRLGVRGDLTHNFAPADFDYFRAGPFVSWNSHERNLGHYTFGHGGYYSPQSDLRAGLLIDGLTPEGRKWIFRTTASAGFGRSRENSSPRFPLTPDVGGRLDKATSTGIYGDLAMRGAVLLGPKLILGSYANLSGAPGYGAGVLGIVLQIPLQHRAAVVSADLPESALGFKR